MILNKLVIVQSNTARHGFLANSISSGAKTPVQISGTIVSALLDKAVQSRGNFLVLSVFVEQDIRVQIEYLDGFFDVVNY